MLYHYNTQNVQFSGKKLQDMPKKQESMAHSQERKKLIGTVQEEAMKKVLDLLDKDFKTCML